MTGETTKVVKVVKTPRNTLNLLMSVNLSGSEKSFKNNGLHHFRAEMRAKHINDLERKW